MELTTYKTDTKSTALLTKIIFTIDYVLFNHLWNYYFFESEKASSFNTNKCVLLVKFKNYFNDI